MHLISSYERQFSLIDFESEIQTFPCHTTMFNTRQLKDDARRRRRCKLDLEYWFIRNPDGPPVSTAKLLLFLDSNPFYV